LWPGTVVPKPSAMALTIALGAAGAAAVFGELTLEEALILAVVLAPTDDGALGKALVTEPRVPQRIRQDLNAESGLNERICVPLLFAAVAIADVEPEISGGRSPATLLLQEIGDSVLGIRQPRLNGGRADPCGLSPVRRIGAQWCRR
jgi:NhaP-type Na+/H+ or K+/H+ antiporter